MQIIVGGGDTICIHLGYKIFEIKFLNCQGYLKQFFF